jgi:hypothetical protein
MRTDTPQTIYRKDYAAPITWLTPSRWVSTSIPLTPVWPPASP